MDLLRHLFDREEEAEQLKWGASPLVFTPSQALRSTVSASELDGWLDCSLLRHPFFSVISGGNPVALNEVTSVRVAGGEAQDGYIDGAKVRRCLDRGATLMVANLHEWHAPAQRLCRDLAERLSVKAGAVVFYTPAANQGLRVHRDDCHVLVIQLAGSKHWSLYDIPREAADWKPGFVDPDKLSAPIQFELRAGQALYLPEGQAHAAQSLGEASMHLTIGLREPRLRGLMSLAVNACLASIPEHASLTGSSEQRRRTAEDLLQRLSRALTRIDVADLVASMEKRTIKERGSY